MTQPEQAEPRGSTREHILQTALRILARDGYQGVTARRIAAEAGTNVALVNYYFGSKRNLLLEMFGALDAEKLHRQHEMFGRPDDPLSRKWRQAAEFYRIDLADGYVRVMQELYAQGYADPVIGKRVRERMNGWRSLLETVARTYADDLQFGIDPALIAGAVVSFWLGMEVQHLAGSTEDEGRFFEILDRIGDWIEERERRQGIATAAAGG